MQADALLIYQAGLSTGCLISSWCTGFDVLAAGQLNRRLTIQLRASGQDAYGQPSGAWSDLATVYASYRAPTGMSAAGESISGNREVSAAVCSWRIRYRTDITAGMRAVEGTTVYDIRQVLPDIAKREHVDLVCEFGASEG